MTDPTQSVCPTCGEAGPDTFDRVGDYGGGPYEARCGDDWHDDQRKMCGCGAGEDCSVCADD